MSTPRKKTAAHKSATTTAIKEPAKRPAARPKPAPRSDYGAPIEGFFAKQPPHLRAILDALRAIVEE